MTDQRDRVTTLCHEIVGARPLVHLSFFDGIGVAWEALRRINNNVLLTLSWEIDPACIQFVTQTFSSVPMGDVAEFDIECVVQHIEAKLQRQDHLAQTSPVSATTPRAPRVHPVGSSNICWGWNTNFENASGTSPLKQSSRMSFHIRPCATTSLS